MEADELSGMLMNREDAEELEELSLSLSLSLQLPDGSLRLLLHCPYSSSHLISSGSPSQRPARRHAESLEERDSLFDSSASSSDEGTVIMILGISIPKKDVRVVNVDERRESWSCQFVKASAPFSMGAW